MNTVFQFPFTNDFTLKLEIFIFSPRQSMSISRKYSAHFFGANLTRQSSDHVLNGYEIPKFAAWLSLQSSVSKRRNRVPMLSSLFGTKGKKSIPSLSIWASRLVGNRCSKAPWKSVRLLFLKFESRIGASDLAFETTGQDFTVSGWILYTIAKLFTRVVWSD